MSQTLQRTNQRVASSVNIRVLNAGLVVGASLLMAVCAHVSIPLWFTPVPITLQTFGVMLLALTLGGWRASAALVLYLVEGISGLPVFSPTGPGGIAQILGPTGGYLMAYPLVAATAGFVFERGARTFALAAIGGFLATILLFAGGLTWLYFLTHSLAKAAHLGLY